MVDISKCIESDYLTIDMVKNSSTKRIVMIGEGQLKINDYGNLRLELPIEIDKIAVKYTPNKQSLINFSRVWGKETKNFIGKIAEVSTKIKQNRELIIAKPIE